jgi:hypothetical protein
MAYAILRTAKLTSFGNIGGSAQHNFRERKTLNADPEQTPNNVSSGAQSSKEVIAAVKSRLETVPTVRKNAVLAIEYFIGASPEWFKSQSKSTQEAYFDSAEKWLNQRHGAENVITFTRQYDETSPHVCAYVVPIDQKGKLNCSAFLDGREKLSLMQTDFAEKVGKPFQLERGIEGSEAKHKTIKQYYAEIQAPVPDVTISPESVQPKVLKRGFLSSEHETPEMVAERITKAVQNAYRPAVQAAKQHHAEKAANASRQARLSELRETATQARDLPLTAVLEHLGCTPDARDKKNWRTPVGRMTIDGSKFYAHDQAKGGGGAIDLVMLIEETDYKGAVNRLAQDFGTGAVLSQAVATLKPTIEAAAKATPQPYRVPEPRPENWPKVRRYLTDVRRIGSQLVDKLYELGKVYADRYSNAVFVLGKGVGVELRGTGEKPFHGVRGMKGLFSMPSRGENKVAFVESSIDALSLWELGFKGRIVSLSGNSVELSKEMAKKYREDGLTVVAAFDNDKAGEQMAANLGYPRERLYPEGKDWNDDLKASRPTVAERLARDQEAKEVKRRRSGPSMGR